MRLYALYRYDVGGVSGPSCDVRASLIDPLWLKHLKRRGSVAVLGVAILPVLRPLAREVCTVPIQYPTSWCETQAKILVGDTTTYGNSETATLDWRGKFSHHVRH